MIKLIFSYNEPRNWQHVNIMIFSK